MTSLEQAHGYPLLAWTDILRLREERQLTLSRKMYPV
jgi:hypothetical protein